VILSNLPTLTFFYILLAYFIGGITQGILGVGLITVVISLLSFVVDVKETIALVIIPTIITGFFQMINGSNLKVIIKDTKYFLVFSTLIIVPGVFLLNVLESDLILIFIAILLFMNSSLSLSNRVVAIPNHQNSIIQLLTGSLNGFIIGLTSIYTMPFVFLLQSLKYNKEKTVQFMGLAFLLYSSMQFISFSYIKLISINTIVPSLIVTLPVTIGFLLGKKIRSFISEKLFKKLFYLMLLLMSGIILINAFYKFN
jgi:uncharacterized membrane protein YfcA